jgi:YVTN family beta-propeller protein
LFVVCENTDEVLVVDTREREVVGAVGVGDHPFDIILDSDERYLYVSNRWDNTVSVIDLSTMTTVQTFPTGDDPHGLATDRSGKHLFVTNLATNDVSIVELSGFTEVKRLQAGTSPFGIATAPDGKHLYVSNQLSNPVPFRTPPVLELTVIDSESRLVVARRELYSTVIGQGVAVSPDNELAAVALEVPKNLIPETQIYQGWMVTYGLAIVETGTEVDGRTAYLLIDEPNLYFADPFSVVFSSDGTRLYVSSSGVDVVTVIDVERMRSVLEMSDGRIGLADDAIRRSARNLGLSSEYVVARIETPSNPKGLVASPDGRRLYVANRLSDCISVIDTEENEIVGTIDLGGPTTVTKLRHGERLFNHSTISFQKQLSCNTCHPENHLDGLTYDIAIDGGMGRNLVDNRTMRGVFGTAPFKWSGKNPTLFRQEGPRAAQLFFRSHGFERDDQEAIVSFLQSRPFRRNRYASPDGRLNEFQKRGKVLFERAFTNDGRYIPVANRCIACHPPPLHTDRFSHDVGTQAYFDTKSDFDTPHLSNVIARAPFLHDGRCYSLEEIWTRHNDYDLHGATNDMKKEQLNDLIEYTKTLTPLAPEGVPEPMPIDYDFEFPGGASGDDVPARYVGNDACRECHAEAYRIWLGSKHSRTFVMLQRGVAGEMMRAAGVTNEQVEPPLCYGCHATAALAPAENREAGFRIEEGVTCERCHGPGEKHVLSYLRNDGDAGARAALRRPTEDTCMGCHKHKPSHEALGKPAFNFDTYLKKIAHGDTAQR